MKFNCGPSAAERHTIFREWYRWFAWHPVRLGPHDCRWLEYVERRRILGCNPFGYWPEWEYRTLSSRPPILAALWMSLIEYFNEHRA